MRKMGAVFGATLVVVLFASLQCLRADKAGAGALEGTWKGKELGGRTEGTCYLTITGQTMDFRGADTNEWYKGTFTLMEDAKPRQVVVKITDCPLAQYVGKTTHAIYRLDAGVLTIAGNEPGAPEAPKDFNDPEARRFVFKLKQ